MENPYAAPAHFESPVQRRPIGVWFVTIWSGLIYGLYPLMDLAMSALDPLLVDSGPWLTLGFAIALASVGSAIGTWIGNSTARYALVLLACIHCIMSVYTNYQLVQMVRMGIQFPGGESRFWWQAGAWMATTFLISIYLLLNRKANAFFRKNR